jgi:hypothetical protein
LEEAMSRNVLAALAAITCLFACSASPPPATTNSAFATAPLGVASSSSGEFTMTMYGPASGVAQGLNTVEICVTNHEAAPVDGLAIDLVPWMPSMGHGASAIPQIQPKGSGCYDASDVALIMPGTWQLRTSLMPTEEAVVTIEVP